jgi:hypothetical protein
LVHYEQQFVYPLVRVLLSVCSTKIQHLGDESGLPDRQLKKQKGWFAGDGAVQVHSHLEGAALSGGALGTVGIDWAACLDLGIVRADGVVVHSH